MALDLFIRVNGSRLLAFIREVFPAALRTRFEPVDLYQNTVYQAFRDAPSFTYIDEPSTMAWLKQLARRQIGMTLRSERRLRRGGGRRHVGMDDSGVIHLLEAVAAERKTPSQSAVRREELVAIERAMLELPEPVRQAVQLKYLSGFSAEQIGQALERTERAAAALCFRGVRSLRRKLGQASSPD